MCGSVEVEIGLIEVKKIVSMEYYSAIRNNDRWFEGKWLQLEDIMLSEVSQALQHKTRMFSLIRGR
jgi:hypothetical protein